MKGEAAVSDPKAKAAPAPAKRRQGFWLTVGEIVGVLALALTALNVWESHQQHLEARAREQARTRAEIAFVAVGEADAAGHAISLRPLKAAQAIQSQRYSFPHDVLDHPMEITAERPRIEADWIAGGLKRALDAAHAKSSGAVRVPVLIETTYVEDGDTQSDVALYRVGVAWKRGFLGGWQIRLQGIALAQRNPGSAAAAALETRWATARSDLAAR